MEKNILFRTVLEVVGRPKNYIETALQEYLTKLKGDQNYKVVSEEIAEVEKQGKDEMWMTFVELEVKTSHVDKIIGFCFDYMPSLIEVLEPSELVSSNAALSSLFNDLQARLHQVDMV